MENSKWNDLKEMLDILEVDERSYPSFKAFLDSAMDSAYRRGRLEKHAEMLREKEVAPVPF